VTDGQRDLTSVSADGSGRTPLTRDAELDWSPAWSPDGFVYFSSDRGGSMNLWRIPVDEASGSESGRLEPVTTGVQAAAELAGFSQDGSQLVFRSQVAAVSPVRIPFDPSTHRAGTPEVLSWANRRLSPTDVSPDGRLLLLENVGETQEDIFVSRADGSELRRITNDAAFDRAARFSHDGQSAIFFSNRDGTFQVWLVELDGGGLRQLTNVEFGAWFPMFLNLRQFVFSNLGGRRFFSASVPDAGTVADDVEAFERTSIEGTPVLMGDLSPDGSKVVGEIASEDGLRGLAVYDVTASMIHRVPYAPAVQNLAPSSLRVRASQLK
jgi:TolB protein